MMRLQLTRVMWNNNELAWTGGILWLLLLPLPLGEGVLNTIGWLLLLAILFFAPLLLPLIPPLEDSEVSLYQLARALQPLPLLPLIASFFVPRGLLAALLSSGWFLFTGVMALYGLRRLLPWRWPRPEELCISAGLLYLPVGAGWLLLARLGVNPLGFSDAIVLLTAIHFHYAAFAMPILVGMTGRMLGRLNTPSWIPTLYRGVVAGVIAGPPLIALGITFSRPVEVVAATLFALTLITFSLLTLFFIVPFVVGRVEQALLSLSSLILLLTMLLALGYAVGGFTGLVALTIPQMVQLHGWGNALVVSAALLAWVRERPGPIRGERHRMERQEIILRPFTSQDQRVVRRLILEGLAERFGHMNRSINRDLHDIEASYLLPGHAFFVAEWDREIIGTGALLIQDGETGQLVRFSVRRDHRGQGLGSLMVAYVIEEARRRGLTRLIVETNHDWCDARALYERCGFTPYKEAEGNIYMEQSLKPKT